VKIPYDKIKKVSDEFVEILKPYCKKIMVCGSIRRKCEFCKDIDIVLIPDSMDFKKAIEKFIVRDGKKWIVCRFKGIDVDVYLANEQTFEPLVLIRTGSRNFNVKFIQKAKQKGFRVSVNYGLIKDGKVIENREREMIEMVFGKYIKPEERSW